MNLVTAIESSGIRIGVVKDGKTARIEDVPFFDIRSEHYLRQIEESINAVGGWLKIDVIATSLRGESFTSLRGLVTLVNALSSLHDIPINVFTDNLSDARVAKVPVVPEYSAEPNITIRKT